MQRCTGHLASVDLYRVKNSYRRDLTGTGRRPLNVVEPCFKELVFKLKGNTVLEMVPCPSAGAGVGNGVIGHDQSVDRQIILGRFVPQHLNVQIHHIVICRCKLNRVHSAEAEFSELCQLHAFAVRLGLDLRQSLYDRKGQKADAPLGAYRRIVGTDGAGCKIAAVSVRLSRTVNQLLAQPFKVAAVNKTLTGNDQSFLVRDLHRYSFDGFGVVGNILTDVAVAPGRESLQKAALINDLGRQSVQLQ